MKKLLSLSLLLTSSLTSQEWSPPQSVNDGSMISYPAPVVATNPEGTALVLWGNFFDILNMLAVPAAAFSHDFGNSWLAPHEFITSPTEALSSSAGSILFPNLNKNGNSVLAWPSTTNLTMLDTITQIRASYYSPSVGWGPITQLNALSTGLSINLLGGGYNAIGDNDLACVCWIEQDPTNIYFQSAFNSNNMGWIVKPITSPIPLASFSSSGGPALAMSPSGEHLATYWATQNTMTSLYSLYSSFYDSGSGSWGAPFVISSASNIDAKYPKIVISDSGVAVAAWVETNGGSRFLKTRVYDSMWNPTTILSMLSSSSGIDASSFGNNSFAINDQGHAALIWYQNDATASTEEIKASYFNGTTWDTSSLFLRNPSMTDQGLFSIAINNSDLCIASFTTGNNSADAFGATRTPATSWINEPLDTSNTVLGIGFFGKPIITDQNGLVSWITFDNATMMGSYKTRFFSASSGWSPENSTITTVSMTDFLPTIVTGVAQFNAEKAVASWPQMGQGNTFVYTSVFPAGGGVLPPTNGIGFQTESKFLVSADLINALSWTASTTPNVRYNVYRNGSYIATTYGPSYDDHQRVPGEASLYSVTAVNDAGSESSPILFTVP